jgi:hypothetical protein
MFAVLLGIRPVLRFGQMFTVVVVWAAVGQENLQSGAHGFIGGMLCDGHFG